MAQATDGAIIESEPSLFRDRLNRTHFAFRHRLADHPLFKIPRLLELCRRIKQSKEPKRLAVFRASRGSPQTKFIELTREQDPSEVIGELPEGDKLLRLSCAQEYDDQYRSLHERILEEVDTLSGFALRPEIGWSSMTILLSSPGIITPYHIDHQSNLLFHLRGRKNIWLFDPRDRRVLSESAIERYYGGDTYAADYQEELQGEGTLYELMPGAAVHNPPLAPHWVRNGNEVSVSMSINYSLREYEASARVYQVNRYLRRLGLAPLPPGRSPLRDWIKREPFNVLGPGRPKSLEELLRSGPSRLIRPVALLRRLWRRVL